MNRNFYFLLFLFFAQKINAQADTIPPLINCPAHDTVTLSANSGCGFQYFYAVVSSDNEPGDTLVQVSGLISGSDFPLGNTVNVFVATDAAGNTASCSFQLTVQNYAGPLTCKNNITVSLGSDCSWLPNASSLLDGNFGCTDSAYYLLEMDDTPPYGDGPWLPISFGPDDVGETRAFRVSDTVFGYSCAGILQISDQLPPVLTCQDITVSCAVDVSPYFLKDNLGITAAVPLAEDACGPVTLTQLDNTVPADCASGFVGIISRKWTAQDEQGNTSTCIQQIHLARPVISDLRYPPDVTLNCTVPLSLENAGQPYLEFAGKKFTSLCQLAAAFNDSTIQSCPGSSQVLRTWFVIDFCTGEALDTVQVIEVEDKVGPAMYNSPKIAIVSATNCLGAVHVPPVFVSDGCSGVQSVRAHWLKHGVPDSLVGTVVGDTVAEFEWVNEFPVGITYIQYVATDSCGNTATYSLKISVLDMTAPVAVCKTSVAVSLGNDGHLIFSAGLLDDGSLDDCFPLSFRARFNETNPCFLVSTFRDSLELCCSNIGDTLDVTLRVYDKDINVNEPASPDSHSDECTVQLIVVPTAAADSACQNDLLSVSGQLKTELDAAVSNAQVALDISHPVLPSANLATQSNPQGAFEFLNAVHVASNYTLTPAKDNDHLDGVSTFDLVLITKHILGLEPLNSPYKIVAADANKSNSVTTFDVVEIRKLILGIYAELPANDSWRFVDEDFVFPNPANPFQTPFPESIVRTNVGSSQTTEDFVGIKVGDVNNTAVGDSFSVSPDDRSGATLFFDAKNRDVQTGEEVTVQFAAAEQVQGYQFTLNTEGLQVLEILPGKGISQSNFAIFENAVTTSVETGADAFSIKFRAARAGQLSEMLSISSRITRAEAYKAIESNYGNYLNIALRFDGGPAAQPAFALYQNQPNPFHDKTLIGFYLPEASDATLTVFDETGRVLHTQSGHYPRGYNAVSFEKTLLGDGVGVFYYQLETPTESAVRKMVLLK